MGNNICERMFFTLGENVDNLKRVWTDQDFANYTPHAALDDLAREGKVKGLEKECHQDMQRFFVSSSITNQYPNDMENSKYMSQLSTLIDPEITQQWSLHEIPHYLENIAQAQKNWSKGYVVSSQINYLIHLFFLSEKQAEAAQKQKDEDRKAMMSHVISKIKEAARRPSKKPASRTCFSRSSCASYSTRSRDLILKKDVERISGLVLTIQAALKAIKRPTRPTTRRDDEGVPAPAREGVARGVHRLQGRALEGDLQGVADSVFKLCFYLGELSLHLHVLNALITSGLYAQLSFEYYEAHPLVQGLTSILSFKEPSQPIELVKKDRLLKKSHVVFTEDAILIESDSRAEIFTARPEFNKLQSLASFSFGRESYYFRGQFFTQYRDCTKLHPVTCCSQDHYMYYLNIESQEDFRDNSLEKFRDKGYTRMFYGLNGDAEDRLFLLRFLETKVAHDAIEFPAKIMVLIQHKVPFERCDDTKPLSYKVVMNKAGKPHGGWMEDVENSTGAFLNGKLILHNRQKGYQVIDIESATVVGEGMLDFVVNGIDTLRNLAVEVKESDQTLLYRKMELRTDYEVFDVMRRKDIESSSIAQKLKLITMDDSYDEDLEPLPVVETPKKEEKDTSFRLKGVVTSIFRLVYSRKQYSMDSVSDFKSLDSKSVLKEENRFELSFETFVLINVLFDSLKNLKNKDESQAIGLMLLKILDIHLEVAVALQNKEKDSIKFVNQEYLTKLRKQVETLEFKHQNFTWELQAFDRLKLKVIFQLLAMTRTVKKLNSLPWLIGQLTSSNFLVPLQDLVTYVGELMSLNSKGLVQENPSTSVANLILDSFLNSSETQLAKEKVLFTYLWSQNKGDKNDDRMFGCAHKRRGVNLCHLFKTLLKKKSQFPEIQERVFKLVEKLPEVLSGIETLLDEYKTDFNNENGFQPDFDHNLWQSYFGCLVYNLTFLASTSMR
jgi:hypothetical protein